MFHDVPFEKYPKKSGESIVKKGLFRGKMTHVLPTTSFHSRTFAAVLCRYIDHHRPTLFKALSTHVDHEGCTYHGGSDWTLHCVSDEELKALFDEKNGS